MPRHPQPVTYRSHCSCVVNTLTTSPQRSTVTSSFLGFSSSTLRRSVRAKSCPCAPSKSSTHARPRAQPPMTSARSCARARATSHRSPGCHLMTDCPGARFLTEDVRLDSGHNGYRQLEWGADTAANTVRTLERFSRALRARKCPSPFHSSPLPVRSRSLSLAAHGFDGRDAGRFECRQQAAHDAHTGTGDDRRQHDLWRGGERERNLLPGLEIHHRDAR